MEREDEREKRERERKRKSERMREPARFRFHAGPLARSPIKGCLRGRPESCSGTASERSDMAVKWTPGRSTVTKTIDQCLSACFWNGYSTSIENIELVQARTGKGSGGGERTAATKGRSDEGGLAGCSLALPSFPWITLYAPSFSSGVIIGD